MSRRFVNGICQLWKRIKYLTKNWFFIYIEVRIYQKLWEKTSVWRKIWQNWHKWHKFKMKNAYIYIVTRVTRSPIRTWTWTFFLHLNRHHRHTWTFCEAIKATLRIVQRLLPATQLTLFIKTVQTVLPPVANPTFRDPHGGRLPTLMQTHFAKSFFLAIRFRYDLLVHKIRQRRQFLVFRDPRNIVMLQLITKHVQKNIWTFTVVILIKWTPEQISAFLKLEISVMFRKKL